jgi:hypothetical protein
MDFEDFSKRIFYISKTSYPIVDLRLAYNALLNSGYKNGGMMAHGGQIDDDTLWELSSLVMYSINPDNKLSLDEFLYAHRNGEKPLMTDEQEKLVVFVLKMYDDVENITEKTLDELATLVMDSINSDVQLPLYKFMDEVPLTNEQDELCGFVEGMYDDVVQEFFLVKDSKTFEKGGAIEDQYEGRSPEDIWNHLTERQRIHFLADHRRSIIGNDPKEPYYENSKKNWNDLDGEVSQGFYFHVMGGQYAKGGMMADGGMMAHGGKLYYTMNNVGKAKYTIHSHDGNKTHKDGSPFYDIDIFSNRKDFDKAVEKLESEGYKYRYADGGMMADGGEVYYVRDFYPNYDEDKIASILKSMGAKKVRKAKLYGYSNQPDVVVFESTTPVMKFYWKTIALCNLF